MKDAFRLSSIDGDYSEKAWANKVTANLGGLPVSVIGKAELIANNAPMAEHRIWPT